MNVKEIAASYLKSVNVMPIFGLAELNRHGEWKVPVLNQNGATVGEVFINCDSSINYDKTTKKDIINSRESLTVVKTKQDKEYKISNLKNTLVCGNSSEELKKLPDQSIDLIFTSPPYYNARPQYQEYKDYQEYLDFLHSIIKECKRVLVDGRFFAINLSHVLVPRSHRNQSSKRLAVPFDVHNLFMKEEFDFIDDIIWEKPEGAGWVSGRGRRFAADRNALQYKTVPVTEYVLVYRKPGRLIDWFIRNHPNQDIVEKSKIENYDKTNVWKICPSHSKIHPATFPSSLAEKVIKYYSFINDVVLDPFAGIGTVGKAAINLGRRYYLIEKEQKYIDSLVF